MKLVDSFTKKMGCYCKNHLKREEHYWGFPKNWSPNIRCAGYQSTPATNILANQIAEPLGDLLSIKRFWYGE